MPLFDPAIVPEEVLLPRDLEATNEVYAVLLGWRLDGIVLPEKDSKFRVSNMIRAYCQSHLWRCLELAETAELLIRSNHGLAGMMVARAIYETTASFLHFEEKLNAVLKPLESLNDIARIEDFIIAKTFATRLDKLIIEAGTDDVKATSILTQVEKMGGVYKGAIDDYNHLCEFTHPNVYGSFLWFGDRDPKADEITFSSTNLDKSDARFWVLSSVHLMGHFAEAFARIESKLPELSAAGAKLKARLDADGPAHK